MARRMSMYETQFILGAKVNSSVGRAFGTMNKNMSSLQKSGYNTNKTYNTLGTTIKRALGAAGIYFSIRGIITALNNSTDAAMEFEDQMADVATLLDEDVSKKIAQAGKETKRLAIQTGISTEQINKGYYQVVSAFGETSDSYDILQKATENARAGNVAVADSVSFLSTVMKGYDSVNAETAKKVSDLGFMTVKLGETDFPALATNMGKVIPLAGAMSAEMEEVFGAMATLTGVTGDTSVVSTQLRGVFSALTKPTAQMEQTIKALGYESGKAMIESEGLQGTLEMLRRASGGSEQRLAQMFGRVEALNAVLALTGPQAESFTEKTAAMYDAVGKSNEAFQQKIKTSKALRERFNQLINVLKITAGESILPRINQGLEYILENYDDIAAAAKDAFRPVVGIYNFIKKNWSIIGPIVEGITVAYIANKIALLTLIAVQKGGLIINSLANAWSYASTILSLLREGNSLAAIAQMELNAAMAANPIGLIIAGIVALIFVGYLLYKNWDKITAAFKRFYAMIENIPIIQAFVRNIKAMIGAVKQIFNGIVDFVKNVFTGNWGKAWEAVVEIFKGIVDLLAGIFKMPLNAVIGLINAALNGINKISLNVPDWVPMIGGKEFGVNIPQIPYLAQGTPNFPGGLAVVGERGPELLNLPGGTEVTPASKTEKLLNSLTNITKNIKLNIDWNPQIIIKGNASKEDVKAALIETKEDFRRLMIEILGYDPGNPRTDFAR